MKVGVIIGRYGDIDGVSLETKKWVDVLVSIGHEVSILSGQFTNGGSTSTPGVSARTLPALSFFSPECEWEQKRAFFYPDDDPDMLLEHLERTSNTIAMHMFRWILEEKIEILLAQNSCALPCHLSMGMAIRKVVEHTGVRIVTHDHDFHWERGDRYNTPHKEIEEIINSTFPLQLPHVRHAVINLAAKQSLQDRFEVDSVVVPNVMDFNKPYGDSDEYNQDFNKNMGLGEKDIVLGQVTRIVKRKGIEVAINLVGELDDPKVKLIITGSKADDERFGYHKELVDLIEERKLTDRVLFGSHRIGHKRNQNGKGEKMYSLSDTYAKAAACTYFSTYEGFGNAFVEGVLAKRPIFVNNYKPVYWPEIGSKGFRTVMLEDNDLTDKAVGDIDQILHDPKMQKEIGEYNFELGKKHFSYEVLKGSLQGLFQAA